MQDHCVKQVKYKKKLMRRHCGINNRAPLWTFTDLCKREVIQGAREESASPACLAAPAMNACDTTKMYIYGGLTLDMDRHYMGSVTATTHQEKGIIHLRNKLSLDRDTKGVQFFCPFAFKATSTTWTFVQYITFNKTNFLDDIY